MTHFCFRKDHLQEVANQLWPRLQSCLSGHKGAVMVINGKYILPYETLLLLVLYRFSRPKCFWKDMESFFGIFIARMSSSTYFIIHAMHALGVLYLDNPEIFHWRMPYYAERVHNKCGLTESVWGFIHGTLCKTCCPSYFQKLMCSGHKQCHGIKFQSIVTPDGFIASMYGPVNGNWHDSFLLSTSGLVDKIQAFMPDLLGTIVRVLVWWSSIPSINQYLWRIQEPFKWLYPCTLEYINVKSLWGGGMGVCYHSFSVVFPGFQGWNENILKPCCQVLYCWSIPCDFANLILW